MPVSLGCLAGAVVTIRRAQKRFGSPESNVFERSFFGIWRKRW